MTLPPSRGATAASGLAAAAAGWSALLRRAGVAEHRRALRPGAAAAPRARPQRRGARATSVSATVTATAQWLGFHLLLGISLARARIVGGAAPDLQLLLLTLCVRVRGAIMGLIIIRTPRDFPSFPYFGDPMSSPRTRSITDNAPPCLPPSWWPHRLPPPPCPRPGLGGSAAAPQQAPIPSLGERLPHPASSRRAAAKPLPRAAV